MLKYFPQYDEEMMREFINIPGEPIPQMRHRDFRKNGMTIRFDPCKQQKKVFARAVNFFRNQVYEGPLDVELIFATKVKPSITVCERNERLWNVFNDHKSDIDNLEKFVLDACNGVLWRDDSLIVSLKSTKIYSENPFTRIYVMEKNKMIFEGNMKILSHISPDEYRKLTEGCKELSEINIEPTEKVLGGLEPVQQAAADCLVKFVSNNFCLFQKLYKEIIKWSKDGQDG